MTSSNKTDFWYAMLYLFAYENDLLLDAARAKLDPDNKSDMDDDQVIKYIKGMDNEQAGKMVNEYIIHNELYTLFRDWLIEVYGEMTDMFARVSKRNPYRSR